MNSVEAVFQKSTKQNTSTLVSLSAYRSASCFEDSRLEHNEIPQTALTAIFLDLDRKEPQASQHT